MECGKTLNLFKLYSLLGEKHNVSLCLPVLVYDKSISFSKKLNVSYPIWMGRDKFVKFDNVQFFMDEKSFNFDRDDYEFALNHYFKNIIGNDCDYLIVDEVQFLSKRILEELIFFCEKNGIKIIFSGLEFDYNCNEFENTKYLKSISDINLIKLETVCKFCFKNNAKTDWKTNNESDVFATYKSICMDCFEIEKKFLK